MSTAAAGEQASNGASTAPFGVLFVCTGNICRSPTAEVLLRERIGAAGVGDRVTTASAGVATEDGWRMDRTIAGLHERRGLSGTDAFRSRLLNGEMLGAAGLILTGTREHRLRIGRLWPDAYPKTFTLRECSWLLGGMSDTIRAALPAGAPARVHAVVRWLQEERGLVATPESELDIADPIGRRPSVYRRMVDDVAAAIEVLADAVLPAPQS